MTTNYTQVNSVSNLVSILRQIEASSEVPNNEEAGGSPYLTDGEPDDPHPLVQEASSEASMVLITNSGQPDFSAHRALLKEGFRVTAGETDSFGWLTGCIHTSKGIIVYG